MVTQLTAENAYKVCNPDDVGCDTSQELTNLETIVGQDRAIRAMQFGLGIKEKGFNVFVSGLPGTGRTTAVRGFLQEMARGRPVPDDWCYVYNFRDSYRPAALRLPPGLARQFQADMKALVAAARQGIRAAFETEEYASHRQATSQGFQHQREALFTAL